MAKQKININIHIHIGQPRVRRVPSAWGKRPGNIKWGSDEQAA